MLRYLFIDWFNVQCKINSKMDQLGMQSNTLTIKVSNINTGTIKKLSGLIKDPALYWGLLI